MRAVLHLPLYILGHLCNEPKFSNNQPYCYGYESNQNAARQITATQSTREESKNKLFLRKKAQNDSSGNQVLTYFQTRNFKSFFILNAFQAWFP